MDDQATSDRLRHAAAALRVARLRPLAHLAGAATGVLFDTARRGTEVVLVALDGTDQAAALAERIRTTAVPGLALRAGSRAVLTVTCASTHALEALCEMVAAQRAGWDPGDDGHHRADDGPTRTDDTDHRATDHRS